ncbi:SRPBCC family protein [Roseivirga sp. E12]|uniref:SRPBCC family protein n=1 Tax=Roseivirga sp. E12 TaxID=2819237 RepID=UPI001ABC8047|nr:SRPBCC family protein [Roseivirga sp. E12]MBO3700119.1 SRPBCC family protein [Roseivirga sp. E12]
MKKVQKFEISKVIPFPAQKVWALVGEDYGAVAYSHPKVIESEFINGSLKAGEGAERICYFNEKHTQYLQEKMVDYSPETMSFTNEISQAGRFPVNPEYTKAVYNVDDLGNGTSMLTFTMQYRTKPAFMGPIAKGSFKTLISDYFIAIEHHLRTDEKVTKNNFKQVKKEAKARARQVASR